MDGSFGSLASNVKGTWLSSLAGSLRGTPPYQSCATFSSSVISATSAAVRASGVSVGSIHGRWPASAAAASGSTSKTSSIMLKFSEEDAKILQRQPHKNRLM